MYVTKVEAAELKLHSNTMNWWVGLLEEDWSSLEPRHIRVYLPRARRRPLPRECELRFGQLDSL
jgi:hypothetical protein